MPRKYEFTESEVEALHKLVASNCAAYKNWIAMAVEAGKFEYAQGLVAELREQERLFAKTNVDAHRAIEQHNE